MWWPAAISWPPSSCAATTAPTASGSSNSWRCSRSGAGAVGWSPAPGGARLPGSGLDQTRRSPAGAVGIMQVRPETARDPSVAVAQIDRLENNIEAAAKYLRHLIDVYFADPAITELDRMLLAFAAYNAGPSRLSIFVAERPARPRPGPMVWPGRAAGRARHRPRDRGLRRQYREVLYGLSRHRRAGGGPQGRAQPHCRTLAAPPTGTRCHVPCVDPR